MAKVQFQVNGLDSNTESIFNEDVTFDGNIDVNSISIAGVDIFTAIPSGASSTLTISTPTFTTNEYTVVLTDKDKWLELSNGATAGTLNIPTDATANFPIGTQLNILQTAAGQITIAAVTPGTTTVNGTPGLKLRGQWSAATIVKRSANTWVAVGDLSE